MSRYGALIAALSLTIGVAACTGQGSASPSTSRPASPSGTAGSGQSASASDNSAGGRCATGQLRFSLGKFQGATGHEVQAINLTNQSGSTCYLGGYPGVELLDSNGQHLQDAERSTQAFTGTYAPPHRVEIPPGGGTTFDLTWQGTDPCDATTRAQHGATLKITPPNDFDAATLAVSNWIVCPGSLAVHPVGSTGSIG